MLHRYGICPTGWLIIYIKNLSRFFIPFNLIFKIVVGACIFMPWKSPSTFWFREPSNGFMYIQSTSVQIFPVGFILFIRSDFSGQLIKHFRSCFLNKRGCSFQSIIKSLFLQFWVSQGFRSIISSHFYSFFSKPWNTMMN